MRGRRRLGPPLGTPATPGTVLTPAIVGTDPYDPGVGQGADGIHSRPIRLRGGGSATVHLCRAPLPPAEGAALGWFLEGAFGADEKPDLFVTVAAKGLLEETARNDFAWADIEGAVVATAWSTTPADEPRLGTMGEVFTDPSWRGQGLAPAVCGALLERFDAAGGRLLFLGTGEPTAARIYASLGFVPWPRGLMRRDVPSAADGAVSTFDAEWWAPSPVTIRPIAWGDVPRIVALYAAPNPWLSACWMQGLYSASVVTHDRCNSLVKHTWQATRPGAWLGIVSERGALVGSAPLEPYGNERAVRGGNLDIFVHAAFRREAPGLLSAVMDEARHLGWRWLGAELGEADVDKRALLDAHGFRVVGRRGGVLEIAGAPHDVVLLRADLAI
jgi:GNAT superfamily N-acetyltransferase